MNQEITLDSVKADGHLLRYVKDQTPEICLEAVRSKGMSLQYVKEQTPEICLAAVKQNVLALKFVKEEFREPCSQYVDEVNKKEQEKYEKELEERKKEWYERSLHFWYSKQDEVTKREFMKIAERVQYPNLDEDQYDSPEQSLYTWYPKQDEATQKGVTEMIGAMLQLKMHLINSTETGFMEMANAFLANMRSNEEEDLMEGEIIFYRGRTL
jgi:hypothetical protein